MKTVSYTYLSETIKNKIKRALTSSRPKVIIIFNENISDALNLEINDFIIDQQSHFKVKFLNEAEKNSEKVKELLTQDTFVVSFLKAKGFEDSLHKLSTFIGNNPIHIELLQLN